MVDWSPYLMTEEQVRDRMATENADAKFNLDVPWPVCPPTT